MQWTVLFPFPLKLVLTLASFLVAHGFRVVARETFLAIVTMAAGSVVPTARAHASAALARKSIQFGVKATLARVPIAVAC